MSDTFLEMLVFARVSQHGNLSKAARDMNISLTVVSRKLGGLEERLGVRLFNRTTRSLALTEEGARFYDRCVRILAEVEDAETEVQSGRDVAVGKLKITSTIAFGCRWLAPLLLDFQKQHPGLQVQLDTDDGVVNIVERGYDLAIRFGALADSRLISKQLAPNRRVICGSPFYLDSRGRPRSLDDLAEHVAVVFGDPTITHWSLADGSSANLSAKLVTNNGELAHRWVLAGAGLTLKSIWDVHEDVTAGRLEVVLPELRFPSIPIHAVYPHSRLAAAKVRLCVEFLARRLTDQVPDIARS